MQTNLRDIIQNPHERIAILERRGHAIFITRLQEDYLHAKRLGLGSLESHDG
jgi:hypothetical protein